MAKKSYIGIDIGIDGGLSIIDEDRNLIFCEPMPTVDVFINKKNRKKYNLQEINQLIESWKKEYKIHMAGIERLRPIPKQSSQTGFSLGGGSMLFKELFTILGIPFVEIEPHVWQKEIFNSLGVQYNKKNLKQASILAAKQLFPSMDFKPTERAKKESDGMTDSCLIAEYTRMNFN